MRTTLWSVPCNILAASEHLIAPLMRGMHFKGRNLKNRVNEAALSYELFLSMSNHKKILFERSVFLDVTGSGRAFDLICQACHRTSFAVTFILKLEPS